MNRKIRIINMFALAGLAAASACTTSAAGLLGQRYLGVTLDYVNFDDSYVTDNGYGVTLALNHPVAKSIDLTMSYSYLRGDIEIFDDNYDAHEGLIGGRWFSASDPDMKPFFGAQVGFARASVGGNSDSEFIYNLNGGVEFAVARDLALIPYVGWTDGFDSDIDGAVDFGVMASIDFGGSWNLIASISLDDDSNLGASIGMTFGL